jgi:phosphatidylinositol 4-kinase B
MCHKLIFEDIPPPMPSAYPGLSWPSLPQFLRKKVKPRPYPALIGMSMVLAGSPGLPALSKVMGEVAIEQGRIDRQGSDVKSLERHGDDLVQGKALSSYEPPVEDDEVDSPSEDVEDTQVPDHLPAPLEGTKVESGVAGKWRRDEMMRAVRTSPSLSLRKEDQLPRFSDDPLGQLDPVPPAVTQSVPSLPFIKQPHQRSASSVSETLLNRYDFESQIHLLRSHFCRSEVCVNFFPSM